MVARPGVAIHLRIGTQFWEAVFMRRGTVAVARPLRVDSTTRVRGGKPWFYLARIEEVGEDSGGPTLSSLKWNLRDSMPLDRIEDVAADLRDAVLWLAVETGDTSDVPREAGTEVMLPPEVRCIPI